MSLIRLTNIERANWDAWWECRWRTRLPHTRITWGTRGELYAITPRGNRISIDRARARGKAIVLQERA